MDWENPVGWIGSTSGNQPRAGDVTGTNTTGLVQLGERRLPCKQDVVGSIPCNRHQTHRKLETSRKSRSDAACDGKRISPCRRVGVVIQAWQPEERQL